MTTNGNYFNFGFSFIKSWLFDVGQEASFDATCLLWRRGKMEGSKISWYIHVYLPVLFRDNI